ncbi:MAG TPA: type II toxin-antitoxin system prevent-host-death family antitoxin [Mycobacteriales bacterium]|jgi:prevent-host-death family protein|nr:type II toxin-antitoxin system prevent-host-death family antitoxin [Mycobacteriales bacterium]
MERIGVREARQNLSVYLERVQRGEVFTVTQHGRPVALLSPLAPGDDPLADLVAAGLADPPVRLVDLPEPVPSTSGIPYSELLSLLRDEEQD